MGNIRVMFPASKDEISVLFSSKRKSLLLRFIIKHGQMLLYRSCSQKMCRMTRHYSSPTIKLGLTRLESTFFGLSKETFLPFLLKTFNWYTIPKVQVLSKNPFLVYLWLKMWIFGMKYNRKLFIRVTYFLQIRVGWIYRYQILKSICFRNLLWDKNWNFNKVWLRL